MRRRAGRRRAAPAPAGAAGRARADPVGKPQISKSQISTSQISTSQISTSQISTSQVSEPQISEPRLRVVGDGFYPDWEAVYRDNVDRVYRLMFAKVGNRPDAEDLTAEVFLTALRPLRVSASAAEVRAYLLTTARTVLAGYWRRTLGHEVTRLRDDDSLEAAPDDAAATAASADALGQASVVLGELPEHYRRILQLRFLDACPLREAAAAMGVSVAYAKVLQHRALRRAAQLLEAGR